MKELIYKFEVEDNTDNITFLDCLMGAMDNWNQTELDKCSCVIEIKGESI